MSFDFGKASQAALIIIMWAGKATADKKITLSEGAELLEQIADFYGVELVHDLEPKKDG